MSTYRWDLSKLNGFDFYLYAQWTFYDRNPVNFYYVAQKAADFDLEGLPPNQYSEAYGDFIDTMAAYLDYNDSTFKSWIVALSDKISQEAQIPIPEPFKNFFANLDSGIDNSD